MEGFEDFLYVVRPHPTEELIHWEFKSPLWAMDLTPQGAMDLGGGLIAYATNISTKPLKLKDQYGNVVAQTEDELENWWKLDG